MLAKHAASLAAQTLGRRTFAASAPQLKKARPRRLGTARSEI
jgi:hypothetical protein